MAQLPFKWVRGNILVPSLLSQFSRGHHQLPVHLPLVAYQANIALCGCAPTHPYCCRPLNGQRRHEIVVASPLPFTVRQLDKHPALCVVSTSPPYRCCHRGPVAAASMSSSLLGGLRTIVIIPGSEQRLHLDKYWDPNRDYRS